jgi:YihY family inner membrane protein
LAYLTTLIFFEGIIALVGLASALGSGGLSDVIVKTLQKIAPGPAGTILTNAVQQAHKAGSSHHYLALSVGLVAALITGTTYMGQIERAMNRLYGVEKDRDTVRKYAHALLLLVVAGGLAALGFAGLALGGAIASSLGGHTARTIWNIARWPIGIALLMAATALIFRWAPRRHQPAWSWLSFGAAVAVGLLAIVTLALNLFFQFSTSFGSTYGPLAGVIALAFWSFFSSLALLMGVAVAAQLEAVRAGDADPRSARKVAESEPQIGVPDGGRTAVEWAS